MRPFWPSFGAAASVDWCEPNYVWSGYVAELWNTLSSGPIAAAGFCGLLAMLLAKPPKEVRFAVAFAAIGVIGLGSMGFHGTLLKSAQAADELPMVYAGLVFAYVLRWRQAPIAPDAGLRAQMRRWRLGLAAYAAAFTVGYFSLAAYFILFITSYALIVAAVVGRSAYITFRLESDRTLRRLFWWSSGAYVAGVGGLWIPEHVLLPCDHPLQALQLHALFHLTSAIGSGVWVLWALHDRQRALACR